MPRYYADNFCVALVHGGRFGVLNEGQAIAVAKNVRVRANEFNPVARAVVNIGPDNTDFELPANLVGATPIDVSAGRFNAF